MREVVLFRDRQELQAKDWNESQQFCRATFDDLIRDAIQDGKGFAGFEVTQATSSEVSVAAGRLYAAGAMFFRDTPTAVPLATHLPLVTRRKVAIVVWGLVSEIDTEPRDFVVDVQTGETEPQIVAMHAARAVQMQAIAGIESPDPQPPANLGTDVLPVAYVTLSTSGIVAIEPAAGNRLPNLADVEAALAAVEAWKDQVDPRIATIASELAELKRRLAGLGTQRDLFAIAADMARVKEMVGLPDDYAEYGADHFLDTDETDIGNLELLAKTEEGIRFGPENAGESQIAVFNPLDPNIRLSAGLVLPAYDKARRIAVLDYVSELSIAQYGYQTIAMKQLTMSRERIRYGMEFTVCTNAAWFRSGKYDPTTRIFTRAGETFEVSPDTVPDTFGGKAHFIRVRQYWRDFVDEPYWAAVTENRSITGASVAQTFLNSQDGWLTALSVWFTRLAGSGNVTVAICETTDSGVPNPNRVISYTTIDYAALRIGWTTIDVPPVFLTAGKHYAIRLVTNADHWIGMASGNRYANGTFFYTTDGVFYAGDLTRDMMFALDFAQFRAARVEVQLSPLQLNGGIAAIDILAPMITTEVAGIEFQVQIGGLWKDISDVSPNALIGLPPLLPLRAVFNGTRDVQGGLQTSGSVAKVSRPRTAFKHISSVRLLAVATEQVHVVLRLEAWNPAHHAVVCKLLVGDGYTTVETADATETRDLGLDINNGNGVIERTYTFNLAAPRTSYKIQIEGTTTTALDVFHVSERVDLAF